MNRTNISIVADVLNPALHWVRRRVRSGRRLCKRYGGYEDRD